MRVFLMPNASSVYLLFPHMLLSPVRPLHLVLIFLNENSTSGDRSILGSCQGPPHTPLTFSPQAHIPFPLPRSVQNPENLWFYLCGLESGMSLSLPEAWVKLEVPGGQKVSLPSSDPQLSLRMGLQDFSGLGWLDESKQLVEQEI